jgi:NADPH-dependent 2,4-dienoyl-CoA reductase/sulfur reductase-like enzyme
MQVDELIAGDQRVNIYGSKEHVVIVGGGFAGLACTRNWRKTNMYG